ncbi:hypothetical protein [Pseudoalteromonas obscura]|uniref:Uncharacterized protein n=1 Tax=Pseudoalteromonas obscura TaxID=3048491 RepID=A0ABT7EGW6_9GAMM|nr:hypothetical protein [Pseudoalteromonas sp. P94(2023)]MDK2594268.1 hypothetical protein [Pseudoalteromonas sp. P94(2023)]
MNKIQSLDMLYKGSLLRPCKAISINSDTSAIPFGSSITSYSINLKHTTAALFQLTQSTEQRCFVTFIFYSE